jgi:preprotein translocase subunit SecG
MFFIIILILITAVLLVLVVLAQKSKGGGLSSQFGGSGASNVIGVKKTSDLLERLTWSLAIAILVLSVTVNIIIPRPNSGEIESPNLDRAVPVQELPAIEPDNTSNEGTPLEDLTDDN